MQYYIDPPFYNNIEKLIIDGDDVKIVFEDNYQVNTESKDANNPMRYIVWHNYVEMADIVLASGYRPKLDDHHNTFFHGLRDDSDFMRSLYISLDSHPNYEPMLELLLKYDVIGQPTKEELKKTYDECYDNVKYYTKEKENYIYKMNQGRDEEAEEKIQRTNKKYKYAYIKTVFYNTNQSR